MILGAVAAGILSKTIITGIGHVASATMMHDILFAFIPRWKFNMSSSDAFALQQSGLNEFLFAPVGTETNGMTLSLVSVFARLGNDPWLEPGRLARLPKSEATESLARSIASMPTSIWPLHAANRRPIKRAAADAVRGVSTECISKWCEGGAFAQDRDRSGVRRMRSGLHARRIHDIGHTNA
jgi:hypothetical protein